MISNHHYVCVRENTDLKAGDIVQQSPNGDLWIDSFWTCPGGLMVTITDGRWLRDYPRWVFDGFTVIRGDAA